MKKNPILLLSIILIFFSCETQQKVVDNTLLNLNFEEVSIQSIHEEKWDNPILIQGSSFGHFFQQLYKQGRWDDMLNFTSFRSIQQYGSDSIIYYYKHLDFGYDMKLKSRIKRDDITILNYESQILGKKSITRLNVVVENDTCRLLIDNTLFHLGVSWETISINQQF